MLSLHRSSGAALLFVAALVMIAVLLFRPGNHRLAPAQDKPQPKAKKEVEAVAEAQNAYDQAEQAQTQTQKEKELAVKDWQDAAKKRQEAEDSAKKHPPTTQEERIQMQEQLQDRRKEEAEALRNVTEKTLADTSATKQVRRLGKQLEAVRAQAATAPVSNAPAPNPLGHIKADFGYPHWQAQKIDEAGQALKKIEGLPMFRDAPDPNAPHFRDPIRYKDPRIIPPSVESQLADVGSKWESPIQGYKPRTQPKDDVIIRGPQTGDLEGTSWSGGGWTLRFERDGIFASTGSDGTRGSGSWTKSGNVVTAQFQTSYRGYKVTYDYTITLYDGTALCGETITGIDVSKRTYTLQKMK
ncbi:MAG TPA: hypothetical protein VKS79_05195 [Gemmataceae bacterium]|nr:hypothetical protein [Gemmataceae bacterium]